MSRVKSHVDKAWFLGRIRQGGWKSQREFAPIIGMDHSALSRILNGERHVKSDEVSAIAKKFGASTDEVHAHLGTSIDAIGVEIATPSAAKQDDQVYSGESTSGARERHPLFGCMKGTLTILPGVDLTEPADPDLADYLDKKYGPEVRGPK